MRTAGSDAAGGRNVFVALSQPILRRIGRVIAAVAVGLVLCSTGTTGRLTAEPIRIMVFTKTAGYRHDSIPAGIDAIVDLGRRHGFDVVPTDDAGQLNEATLARFDAVVFLNTTGDILNETQQAALQRYIEGGGGFVGLHAAADTEHDWPWFGRLVGARFRAHPAVQSAVVQVVDREHPSTAHLPARWQRVDEWYDYQAHPRDVVGPDVRILARLDESTYLGGQMGEDHPIAWCHRVGRGRSWYTGGGHTIESYSEPGFLQHVLGGIRWAAGRSPTDLP